MQMQETVVEIQPDRGPPRMNLIQIKKLSTESKGVKFSIESPDWARQIMVGYMPLFQRKNFKVDRANSSMLFFSDPTSLKKKKASNIYELAQSN